jgi:ABC-2 type transport system permease protein
MKQIIIILKREFLVNIRQKSFLIIALLSPLLFIVPISISVFSSVPTTYPKKIIIVDASKVLDKQLFKEGGSYAFEFDDSSLSDVKKRIIDKENEIFGIIFIPNDYDIYRLTDRPSEIQFFTTKESYLFNNYKQFAESTLRSFIITQRLKNLSIDKDNIEQITSEIDIDSSSLDVVQKNQRALASTVAYIVGMLMYIMFILYNNSLMKGIVEEKSNKIVDVLSLIVKPVYLIIGKILGTACIAVIQLIIWILAFLSYVKILYYIAENYLDIPKQQLSLGDSFFNNNLGLPLWKMYLFIPIFFFFGILINGSLTALIASVGNSNGKSSLGFINNIINILSIYLAMFVASKPDSIIADIFIHVPFFTPVLTPTLMAYDPPISTILSSLFILILSICILIYIAGLVYKTSILSNGRKVSISTLLKWSQEKRI